MSRNKSQEGADSQSVHISSKGSVSNVDIVQAKGNVVQTKNTDGNVSAGDNIYNDAHLLSDLADALKESGDDGKAALDALKEELDKAKKEEPVDEFKLAGIISQIAKLAPKAASTLVDLFAPAIWGKLAKGAVETAVDTVRTMV